MSGIVDPDEKELATEVYAENLRLAARAAEAAGINVVVEPLNGTDVPNYLVQRAAQARAIIAMVADPNLGLQYDAYHALMNGEDPVEGVRANLDVIRHMQVAGCPGRHEPNTGDYDLNQFFEVCDMIGYTGVIGLEYAPANGTEAGLGWASAYGLGRSA
jgi:hydroxypyruvate isomerase